MVDKFVLVSPNLTHRYRELAIEFGRPSRNYEREYDLRPRLPVFLHYKGRREPLHKLNFIGVARIGWPRVRELVEEIFGSQTDVSISRIDLALDVLGPSAWFCVMSLRFPDVQNFRLYRSRGSVSLYLGSSSVKSKAQILVYDKLSELRRRKDLHASLFDASDHLTRFEAQFVGSSVPFKSLAAIGCYRDLNPFERLTFYKLRPTPDPFRPTAYLSAIGVRSLIEQFGLQATAKNFKSPQWAGILKKHLQKMDGNELPDFAVRLKKSVGDWLEGHIRFPRAPGMRRGQ